MPKEKRLIIDIQLHSSHHRPGVFVLSHKSMHIDGDASIMSVLLTAALAALFAYVVGAVTYNVYFHPLANFPGPPLARATVYWKAYVECIANRSFCHYLVELHAKYGETTCYLVPRSSADM